jgi:hypothetical protein
VTMLIVIAAIGWLGLATAIVALLSRRGLR